jgi:hypothetical protein
MNCNKNISMGIDHNKIYCLLYCDSRNKCYAEEKQIPGMTTKDLEKLVMEKFTVGEVYQLWQQAYKKAYGVYPTRSNRPTKASLTS